MRRLAILAVLALEVPGVPASSAGATQTVAMKGIAYEPKQVTVHVGDIVEWANQDIVAHTATARDKSWDVNVLPGKAGRMVMKTPGRFDYICRYHPNMTGEIVVEP
ncbi:cupredoxin domain-containing protein [Microvirga subterranea]|uniref:Plastocyanin n=1 Tax=Microvirga subterranea TaxID=186651 RepID=A0A370HW65_9HYPH|nr:cupredoxin domain-containing protein [Microvirga subterranea]RDI62211.1 plastocyanin [Microvirga subterranea]